MFHLLVTSDLFPIPEGIKVIQDYGRVSIVVDGDPKKTASGKHMIVDGTMEAKHDWFKGKFVWIGTGSPMFQQFEQMKF
jgi:hypothetical protein